MPMTQADVRDCIAPELKEFGMRRRGFRWFWSGPEVRWSLHLAKIPRREWVSFELSGGLAAEDPGTPSSPTGSGFQLHMYLADWDIDEDVTVRMLEDLGYTALPDNTRRALLKRLVAMVCRYVSEHSTVEQLVRAYAAGEYRSSIIFKDLRRTLEREAARPGLDDGGADVRPAPGRSPSPSPGDCAQPRRGRGVDDDASDAPAPLSPGASEAPEIAPPVPARSSRRRGPRARRAPG